MAHPKRQHSRQRQRKRRTHQKLSSELGKLTLEGQPMGHQHRVDPVTGMYKGQLVVNVTPRKKEE